MYFAYNKNCIHQFWFRPGCINNNLIVKSFSKTCLLFLFLLPFEKKKEEPEVSGDRAEVVDGDFWDRRNLGHYVRKQYEVIRFF